MIDLQRQFIDYFKQNKNSNITNEFEKIYIKSLNTSTLLSTVKKEKIKAFYDAFLQMHKTIDGLILDEELNIAFKTALAPKLAKAVEEKLLDVSIDEKKLKEILEKNIFPSQEELKKLTAGLKSEADCVNNIELYFSNKNKVERLADILQEAKQKLEEFLKPADSSMSNGAKNFLTPEITAHEADFVSVSVNLEEKKVHDQYHKILEWQKLLSDEKLLLKDKLENFRQSLGEEQNKNLFKESKIQSFFNKLISIITGGQVKFSNSGNDVYHAIKKEAGKTQLESDLISPNNTDKLNRDPKKT